MFADEQKLPAHLGKAGTAKFLVEQFEYGGHCHPHRWIQALKYLIPPDGFENASRFAGDANPGRNAVG